MRLKPLHIATALGLFMMTSPAAMAQQLSSGDSDVANMFSGQSQYINSARNAMGGINNAANGIMGGGLNAQNVFNKSGLGQSFGVDAISKAGGNFNLGDSLGGLNQKSMDDLGGMGGTDSSFGTDAGAGTDNCDECGESKSSFKKTRTKMTDAFKDIQKYFSSTYHEQNFVPDTARMTQQLIATGQSQVAAIGAMMDAGMQLETQRTLQDLSAQAQATYKPDTGLCTIGTNARALAASSRKAESTAAILNAASISRQMQTKNSAAQNGNLSDQAGRLGLFKTAFCNPADMGGAMKSLCSGNAPARTMNMDVDFGRTVGNARTIQASLTDGGDPGPDGAGLIALARNLYGSSLMPAFLPAMATDEKSQLSYMRTRGITAKRSILENSFNTIAAMKSRGTASDGKFATAILEQMGMSKDAARQALGDTPSYYAMMELLSQTIYQNPTFFSDLYGSPENAARKDVALQAVGLMLDRDQYKSELRSESILAVWLEIEAGRAQDAIMNRFPTDATNIESPAAGGTP